MNNEQEMNNVEAIEAVDTVETPVVSDSAKTATAFGLGGLTALLLGLGVQGGVWLFKKFKTKKAAEMQVEESAKLDEEDDLNDNKKFSEFNEE